MNFQFQFVIWFNVLLFATIHLSQTEELKTECPAFIKYWCGKPYIPKNHLVKNIRQLERKITQCCRRTIFDLTNESCTATPSTIRLPQTREPVPLVPNLGSGYTAMFRKQPYMSTDSFGSLIVSVTNNITSDIAVKASLDDGTEIIAMTKINFEEENIVEVPFSLARIVPKLTSYDVKISLYIQEGDILDHIAYAKLYLLPEGPKTVIIDRLYSGISTSTNEIIFPIGPYVDIGGWMAKGDIQANLQTLKDLNYNIINPDPPYPNISFVHQMFQAADTIGGIYIEYSFRHDYTDIQKIIDQVNQFKDYSSLLTWYIADEPDGRQWTNTSAVFDAYEVIKRSDPYHPVALVLNCEHSAAFYADATDILTTDVYPVGVDMSHCTEYSNVCGCDNCIGSASFDIPKRTRQYTIDLTLIGRESIVKWMVLQAFYDRNSWWERSPTTQEIRVMWYISIIYGYKALMFWQFPFVSDHSIEAPITQLSKEIKDLSSYIVSMRQLSPSHIIASNQCIYAGGWISKDKGTFLLIVVNGNEELSVSFSITVNDLIGLGLISGVDMLDHGQVFIEDGVFQGNLNTYGLGIFIFKKDSQS